MNQEDKTVIDAVHQAQSEIASAVDLITAKWIKGGRVFVVGAGTSGRVGILDAVELGPTFSVEADRWIGLIAGGKEAMWKPLEQFEDNAQVVVEELKSYSFNDKDTLIAISASGSTPYSVAALKFAKEKKAATISISCNQHTVSSSISDIGIELLTGPEIIRGSTRLKAGTAQKMVMNMISTGVMIKLGKVYHNEMIDMQVINKKLRKRAIVILMELSNKNEQEADELLQLTNNQLKLALFIAITEATLEEAKHYLTDTDGHLKKAIELFHSKR